MGTSVLGESPRQGFPTVTRAIVSADGKWVFEEIKLETLPRGGAGERSRSPYQPAAQNKQLSSVASPPAVYNFASAICRGDRCEPPDFVPRPVPTKVRDNRSSRIDPVDYRTPPHAVRNVLCTSVMSDLYRTVGQKHFIKWDISTSKKIHQRLILFVCDNTRSVKALFAKLNNGNIFYVCSRFRMRFLFIALRENYIKSSRQTNNIFYHFKINII